MRGDLVPAKCPRKDHYRIIAETGEAMDSIEVTPLTLIIIGVVSLVLGILATLLLNSLREDSVAPEEGAEAPPGGKKGRYTPVARLWRERGNGRLVVEMDGRTLINPEPLNDIQHERLEKAERDFRAWLGMGLSATEAHTGAAAPARPAAVPQSAPTPTPAAPPAQASAPAAPPARQEPPPIRTVPYTPPISPAVIPPAATPARSNRSIVEQIDDILQDMLVTSPLASRGIHLHQDPKRGVIVQVGVDHYEGIDSVPDPEVKSLLKSAVAAWESTQ